MICQPIQQFSLLKIYHCSGYYKLQYLRPVFLESLLVFWIGFILCFKVFCIFSLVAAYCHAYQCCRYYKFWYYRMLFLESFEVSQTGSVFSSRVFCIFILITASGCCAVLLSSSGHLSVVFLIIILDKTSTEVD